jgi:hypothetical protein
VGLLCIFGHKWTPADRTEDAASSRARRASATPRIRACARLGVSPRRPARSRRGAPVSQRSHGFPVTSARTASPNAAESRRGKRLRRLEVRARHRRWLVRRQPRLPAVSAFSVRRTCIVDEPLPAVQSEVTAQLLSYRHGRDADHFHAPGAVVLLVSACQIGAVSVAQGVRLRFAIAAMVPAGAASVASQVLMR